MSEMIDFLYEQENNNIKIQGSKTLPIKEQQFNRKTPFNKFTKSSHNNQQAIYFQNFIQFDQIYNITVKLVARKQYLRYSFNLIKNAEVFKVESGFMKTYLIGLFSKQNNSLLQPKINPFTGELSLQISSFQRIIDLNQIRQYKNRISELYFVKNKIAEIWKNIISIQQGNFGFQNNINARQKIHEMKYFSSLSRTEPQYQSVYNVKNFIDQQIKKPSSIEQHYLENLIFTKPNLSQKSLSSWDYRKSFQMTLKQKKCLYQNTIRPKSAYCNLQTLSINQKQKITILQQLKQLKNQNIVKVNDLQFGRMFLNYQNITLQKQQKSISNLQMIDKTHEYNFLNYYFLFKDHNNKKSYLFKMALKKINFQQFLSRNTHSLSFQNKLKIFLQIYFALQIMWQKFKICAGLINFMDISITKTLVVKLESIQKWVKIQQDAQQMSDYQKLFLKSQMMVRLNKIFNQVFYNKNIYSFKPSKKLPSYSIIKNDKQTNYLSNRPNEKMNILKFYGIEQILAYLSYSLQKYEQFNSLSEITQNFMGQMLRLKLKYKQGNLDLVLGLIFKSIQLFKLVN